jgi:hypothetical protein
MVGIDRCSFIEAEVEEELGKRRRDAVHCGDDGLKLKIEKFVLHT